MAKPDHSDEIRCTPIKHSSPEYAATVALRDQVLRKPLGLCFSDEQLRAESADHHVACFRDGGLVACLVLTPVSGDTVRMRQVSVASDCQRQGIGTALVLHAQCFATGLGYCEMTAHARETAVPFYRRLGYTVIGDRFIEVGIPHVAVRKSLD
jgi:predicted GNAT family N-acyltransferase